MKNALLPLIVLALAPAAHADIVQTAEATARLGQTVRLGRFLVTPLTVVEDSRCPMNARCVWAGEVRIRARISQGGHSEILELVSTKPVPFAGGKLVLANVMPPRQTGIAIKPRDYRMTLTFERGTPPQLVAR